MSHQAPRTAPSGRARLRSALGFRPTRAQAVAAVLLGLLGFAAAVQIRATQESELDSLRQTDLVRILDDVSERTARLQAEARELERARSEVGGGSGAAALEQAREQSRILGILAGTEPATGSGATLTIWDLESENAAVVLLDALQELRDAGAEAIEIGTVDGSVVRVVASTYVVDVADGVEADGTTLVPPYQLTAIGDPSTLATALDIPGGVLDRVDQEGAVAVVEERPVVEIRSLRAAPSPRYARPAPDANGAKGTDQEGER